MKKARHPIAWQCRDRIIRLGERPLVMGILNVTPDSFSDGGRYDEMESAVRRGMEMADEGADIIDVGGESTRPGADPVPEEVERARVVPVIAELARALAARPVVPVLAVDTRKAEVAEAALGAGASLINDVTALAGDSRMPGVAARFGAGVVLMHMRGDPRTMQQDPQYGDVVAEVRGVLAERARSLEQAGIAPEAMAFDPGIGFGKTVAHNLRLIAALAEVAPAGRPVVLGVSRKRVIGTVTGREVTERQAGSLACAVWAAAHGAQVWRVHDVKESVDAARMVEALDKELSAWTG